MNPKSFLNHSLFNPPSFPDPNQTRKARILHTLALTILVLCIMAVLISLGFFQHPLYGVLSSLGMSLVTAAVFFLNRKGRVQLASWIFPCALWLVNTILIYLSGQTQSALVTGYIATALIAGLLLGHKFGFLFSGTSILVLTLLSILESANLLPPPIFNLNPAALILGTGLNLMLTATTIMLVMNSLEKILELFVENERALKHSNIDLKSEIEARKEAEELLQHSEERFRSAVLDSPYPMMLAADDGEIILINHAWTAVSGYSRRDLQSLSDWQSKAFRTLPSPESSSGNGLSGHKQEGLKDLYSKEGKILQWYFNSAPLPDLPDGRSLFLTTAVDTTELKEAQEALRQSEERYSKIILATNDGIWDWDLTTDQVYFDPQYYTMSGYLVNEFPHHLDEFQSRIHPDDVSRVFKVAEDHLQGISDRFRVEFRFRKKDGTWQWILGRGKIIEQDQQGIPTRMVGTHTDITERKKVEKKLKAYQEELERLVQDRTQMLESRIDEVEALNEALTNLLEDYQKANRKLSKTSSVLQQTNEELESFTYSVSHDLRAPLRAIESFSRILTDESGEDLDPKAQNYLQLIRENSSQMYQLITDLLELSRLGRKALRKEKLFPEEIVQEVQDELWNRMTQPQDNLQIEIQTLLPCFADRRLLKQVFMNLIGNAKKFTQHKADPRIVIGSEQTPQQHQEGKVTYFVRDNGIGFDMEYQDKLFHVFQRLHNEEEYQGTGIGLAIVKRIITRHDGQIWAEGELDQGAVFSFEIDAPPSQRPTQKGS